MCGGLDVIVIDDEPEVCEIITETIKRFYTWGKVIPFTNADNAIRFCIERESSIAIFVVDIFLDGKSGFYFLDVLSEKFTSIYEDTVLITGNANDDIVDMCVASDVNHLLEKPVRPYALQLAVRSIATRYIRFAKKLLEDPDFAESVSRFQEDRLGNQ